MIIKSLINGFQQVIRNKRIVLIFYLFNLLFGILLMLPFRGPMSKMVGHSLMGKKLAGRFDFNFLIDFLAHSENALPAISASLLIFPFLYMLLSLFLSGGTLSVFITGQTYQSSRFWGDSARYFGRFILLGLLMIPVYIILFLLPMIWNGIQRLIWGSDPYQNILYWGGWLKVVLRYIGIYLATMIFDYARIYVIETDETKMLIALKQGFLFVFRNLIRTAGFVFLIVIIGVVVLILYNLIANILALPNVFVIILLLLVQQAYMIFRMMLRLTLFAGQVHLYQNIDSEEVLLASGDVAVE